MNSIPKRILRYFVSGVIAILPFVVTVAIVLWVSNFLSSYLGRDTEFGKILNNIGIHFQYQGTMAYIAGWGLILLLVIGIGILTEIMASRYLVNLFDKTMKKVPVIGQIYGTTRQLTDLINKSDESEFSNMSPVYCRFGSTPGTLCLALLPTSEDYEIEGAKYKLVMIPTAPVPFGGALFFVPTNDVFPAPMSIEKLLNFYISMGVSR